VFDVSGPDAVPAPPLDGHGYTGRGVAATPEGRAGSWTPRGFRVARPYRVTYAGTGFVDTFALDGRAPRTVWGRVFVEACVPLGTRLELGYTTTDELAEDGVPPGQAGAVGSGDDLARLCSVHRRETGRELPWTPLARGDRYEVYEAPVMAPPGRFLRLRVHLTGTQTLSPRVRAVRVECESHDLLGQLPRLYRQDPVAESSLRRFLAIVDGALTEIEWRAVERDRIFDPQGAPAELLPWLGSLIGLTLDHRWPENARRTLIGEAICLFRKRGTLPGLKRLLEIYLDCPVAILEAFRVRGFGGAFVGGRDTEPDASSAVVGRSFRVGGVGSDVTGEDGSEDAFSTHAHRFTVLVSRCIGDEELAVVRDLLDLHRPAHTLVEVCGSGEGMRVGMSLHVEISSILGAGSGFARAVVGSGTLGEDTVLGRGRTGIRPGLTELASRTVVDA
jgi:phage tail-like protein